MKTYKTFSSAETKRLGSAFAKRIRNGSPGRRGASVVALYGPLGSGKTVFTKGVLRGLGVRGRVTSPTFLIMKHFTIRKPRLEVYHFDCYRLRKSKELLLVGFKKILSDPRNIVIIEWAERIRALLPRRAIGVRFEHGSKEHERNIRF